MTISALLTTFLSKCNHQNQRAYKAILHRITPAEFQFKEDAPRSLGRTILTKKKHLTSG